MINSSWNQTPKTGTDEQPASRSGARPTDMLPRRSVRGSLVSLHGSVVQAIGEATARTANRTHPLAEVELRDGNRVLYDVEDEAAGGLCSIIPRHRTAA